MNEPTAEQYEKFGQAAAGILDGHTLMGEEGDPQNVVDMLSLAANIYGIEIKQVPNG